MPSTIASSTAKNFPNAKALTLDPYVVANVKFLVLKKLIFNSLLPIQFENSGDRESGFANQK